MSRDMKSGKLMNMRQLQRCAEFGAPRICSCSGFPEPHVRQYEALPLSECEKHEMQFDLRGLKQPIPIAQFCVGLQTAGEQHLQGYYHYTMWPSFVKMATPIELSPGYLRRVFLMTPPSNKNDALEGRISNHFRFASFSYGPSENVAMWKCYGKYSREAIRICFPYDVMLHWYKSKKHVYKQDDNSWSEVSDQVRAVRLIDVGYVTDTGRSRGRGLIQHRGTNYSCAPSDFVARLKLDNDYMPLLPYFKRNGWRDEREVRLLIEFAEPIDAAKVAIEFEEPLKAVLSDPKHHLVSSPWRIMPTAIGIELTDAAKSSYLGELKNI